MIAAFALFPIPPVQAVLATAASTLFESTPFILAGALLAGVAPRRGALAVSLLGCGCGSGPAARSLPLAAATWLIFGPAIAVARWLAACIAAHALHSRSRTHVDFSFAAQLRALLPFALIAGVVLAAIPRISFHEIHPLVAFIAASVAGIVASPCGFGGLALASTFHAVAPAATAGVLITSGIIDLHVLGRTHTHGQDRHDSLGYLLAAIACALVAAHHGDALVNPRFTLPLALSAAALLVLFWRHRNARAPSLRWPPALMLAAALLSAPPQYYVTQTTLTDAFAGERLDFSGAYVRDREGSSLMRYAITCCRADAQPVAVRLSHPLHAMAGEWIAAHGTLVREQDALVMNVHDYNRAAAPADPFLYR